MRSPVKHALPLAALILLGTASAEAKAPSPEAPPTGPAADYPVVIGDPFTVDGTTYTPSDRLNSDEVGYAAIGETGGEGVSAAHKTLPLPSYAEVTSLDSGKTILVRIERRGPMSKDQLIELSPGAAAQLGIAARAAVRVRRVNPPELDRALLRGGGRAPERMATPKGLLAVLTRKLETKDPLIAPKPDTVAPGLPDGSQSAAIPAPAVAPIPAAKPIPAPVPLTAKPGPLTKPQPVAKATPKPVPRPVPNPQAKPATPANLIVQVGTFSAETGAKSVAAKLAGRVTKTGRFWLTRLGPFATRGEAQAALAKAKAAGYSDARILRAD
jgi:rare lipoprotein A